MALNMSSEAIAAREAYFEEKRAKKKITPTGVTNRDIEIALRRCDGNLTKAAEFVGMARVTFYDRVYGSEHLRAVRTEIVESFVDETESELRKLVKSGNPSAIIFVLKTLGKNRGYIERSTVEHELGPYAAKNAANMIEAMRKGMQEAPVLPTPPLRLVDKEDTDEGEWRVEEKADVGREIQSMESG